MMWMLLACAPDPAPSAPALLPLDMGRSSRVAAWQALQHLDEAALELPPDNLPPGGSGAARFPLTEWTADGVLMGQPAWTAPMPFVVPAMRPQYPPHGAKLLVDGAEVPFLSDFEDMDQGGWRVERGRLLLLLKRHPSDVTVELVAPEMDAGEHRLHLQTSGLSPAAFARSEITVGARTLPGVLVPAPGRASWEVTIPPGARLDIGAGLLVPPLPGRPSDGAGVSVTVDGEEVWRTILLPGDDLLERRIDLSRWAGSTVQLSLESRPGASPVRDHVVFTAPVISAPAPAASSAPADAPRHVVLIGMDTTRYDALSLNGRGIATSPALDRWAEGAVAFDQAWAPAPRTRPSFRATLTGREPLAAIQAPIVAATLQREGFRTAGFTANVHLVPRFGFNEGFTEWHYENGATADVQIGRALAWMEQHRDEDFFVFLHLMDPHTFYAAPLLYRDRFTPSSRPPEVPALFSRWEIYNLMHTGKLGPGGQAWIRGRYDGEVAYMTDRLAAFLAEIERWPARTLTTILSDHGEEFWDHGGYEHNHSLYNELIRVVLLMRPPGGWAGGPHRQPDSVSLLDVVPTILDALDIPQDRHGPTEGRSLRPFLDAARQDQLPALRADLRDRPLLSGHMMFDTERWGVVQDGWKYILHTVSGREELYHLTVDPAERQSLHDDAAQLSAMRAAMARASGWPLYAVWRIVPQTRLKGSVTLTFGAPILDAGIIDPEAAQSIRANLEWGEKPNVTPDEVAGLAIADDRMSLRITGRSRISGQTLWVACPPGEDGRPACPVTAVTGEDGQTSAPEDGQIRADTFHARMEAGWLLVQEVSEAEMLGDAGGETREKLIELGYLLKDR